MRGSSSLPRLVLVLSLLVAAATQAHAAQTVVSTARNVNAVMQARGFYLAPASNVPVAHSSRDLAPTQSFEIVRPNWEKVTIGRLYTSCTCVQLESNQRTFERGERAVLTLRNVIATPPQGQHYAVYVQITNPIRTTLRYDTFVQSSQFVVAAPVEVVEPAAKPADAVAEGAKEDTEAKKDLNTAEGGVQDKSPATEDDAHAAAKSAFENKQDGVSATPTDKYAAHDDKAEGQAVESEEEKIKKAGEAERKAEEAAIAKFNEPEEKTEKAETGSREAGNAEKSDGDTIQESKSGASAESSSIEKDGEIEANTGDVVNLKEEYNTGDSPVDKDVSDTAGEGFDAGDSPVDKNIADPTPEEYDTDKSPVDRNPVDLGEDPKMM